MKLYRIGNQKTNVIHTGSCHYVSDGKHSYTAVDLLPSQAMRSGLHFCRCCSPALRAYRAEKKTIDQFAAANNMEITAEAGMVSISCETSAWKIVPGDARTIRMYHKNSFCTDDGEAVIPGYHLQSYTSGWAMDYVSYIVPHDEFRSRTAAQTREQNEKRRDMIASAADSYYRKNGRHKSGGHHHVPKSGNAIHTDTSDWSAFLSLFKPSAIEGLRNAA